MISAVLRWLRGLWSYYLGYTKTGTHAAAAAGLAIFGILVFIDSAFALLAIAVYVLPPVILYIRTDDPSEAYEPEASTVPGSQGRSRSGRQTPVTGAEPKERVFRKMSTDGDTDSDSDDGDTDTDHDDGDTDSDSD